MEKNRVKINKKVCHIHAHTRTHTHTHIHMHIHVHIYRNYHNNNKVLNLMKGIRVKINKKV